MRDLNIVEHDHVIRWKRVDFASAVVMHRAQAAGHSDVGGLYGIWPTDEQLARYEVGDDEIDELIHLSAVRLADCSIPDGWDLIESWIDDLEFRGASRA